MADQTADEQISKPKSLKFPLIIGLVLALAGAAGDSLRRNRVCSGSEERILKRRAKSQ